MAFYRYQYDTSARKIAPELKTQKKSSKRKNSKKNSKKKVLIKSQKYQDKVDIQEAKVARTNFAILVVIVLGCILLLMYRNVKIRESFAGVQSLSKTVSLLEKENSQILVNIQNNLNLNNIENIAASTLGMQKLSSKQTVYISLDTKEHIEINSKKNEAISKPNLIQKIFYKIKDFF